MVGYNLTLEITTSSLYTDSIVLSKGQVIPVLVPVRTRTSTGSYRSY